MIREDRNFGLFLLSRMSIGFTAFALPFYVLYGQQELQMPAERIGLLIGSQVAGSILSNIVWAELSDRVGNRIVIRLTGLVSLLIPVLTLISTRFFGSTLLRNRIQKLPAGNRPGPVATCLHRRGRNLGRIIVPPAHRRWIRGGLVGISGGVCGNRGRGGGRFGIFLDLEVRQDAREGGRDRRRSCWIFVTRSIVVSWVSPLQTSVLFIWEKAPGQSPGPEKG